jgi:N-acetylglucosaminyldiphosphoundecaprenol N-acetyl-beta-D-mannosaminyltransferase
MDPSPAVESRSILGMRADATSYPAAAAQVLAWAQAGESRYVAVASVNNVMEAYDSPAFRGIMNAADLVTPDGMPLVWGLRLLGIRTAVRVYGPELTPCVLEAAERERIPVGFYGATDAVLERLLCVLRNRYPSLRVAYAWAPPFRALSREEDLANTALIEDSGARILFLGLSTPKQERWMAMHRGRVEAVMLGVGAAFDFLAGAKRQAPLWMRRSGLEWLSRRLALRYLKHNPRFLILFLAQLCGLREFR